MRTICFRMFIPIFCILFFLPRPALPAETPTTSTQPETGFVDQAEIPPRQPMQDIEPIYRGPTVDTLATIRKRGTLRVGVAIAEPMVMHNAAGELIGFSVDVSRKLAEDMGVGIEFVETSWSQIIPDLLDRHFDLILSGLWMTPTRALVINYSNATACEGIYLIANKTNAAQLKTDNDFNQPGIKIAVYAGSIQEHLAKKHFPRATLIKVEGDANQLTPVLEGEVHAVLVPTFAPRTIVNAAPDILALPLAKPIATTFSAIGTRKGDPDLLNYLNTWLAFQRDDGWLLDRATYWATTSDWMK